jgi:hypothetical protein
VSFALGLLFSATLFYHPKPSLFLQVTCSIDGCGKSVIAKADNVSKHIKKAHINSKGGVAAGGMMAYAPVSETPARPAASVRAAEAPQSAAQGTKAAQDAAAAMLFSLGLSAHAIDEIAGPLLDAIHAAKTLQSDTTLLRKDDGALDSVLKTKLLPYLKSLVAGRKVVITVDKKDQKMAGGRGLVNVIISSAHFNFFILAEADVVDFDVSSDASYYIELVERVIKDFDIKRQDIIGISVDNTAVNPAFVRQMKLQLLPCAMHVINLMLEAAITSFNASDLYGWSSFFAHRYKLRADALKAGVKYRVASTAGTRFGSKLPFLEELSKPDIFKMWFEFAKAHPPSSFVRAENQKAREAGDAARGGRGRGRGSSGRGGRASSAPARPSGSARVAGGVAEAVLEEEAKRYRLLLENMGDSFTHAAIVVLHELLHDLAPLLKASQCSVRTIPFDFWQSWEAADAGRLAWFNDPEVKLAALMEQHNINLDVEARAKLETAIVFTLEKMDEKVDSHLMETVAVRKFRGSRDRISRAGFYPPRRRAILSLAGGH